MVVLLPLKKTVDLPKGAGKQIIFLSTVLDLTKNITTDNTSLNLLSRAGDYLLHLSFRRFDDIVVLNSRAGSGHWGAEVRLPNLERAFGPDLTQAVIVIRDIGLEYEIFVNGNYLATYAKRIGGSVAKVNYAINSGHNSIFSNPVTVIAS